jgi:hypothetical protein
MERSRSRLPLWIEAHTDQHDAQDQRASAHERRYDIGSVFSRLQFQVIDPGTIGCLLGPENRDREWYCHVNFRQVIGSYERPCRADYATC